MTIISTNYNLILYNATSDLSGSTIDYLMNVSGSTGAGGSGSSNMQIIDDAMYKLDVSSSPQNKLLLNKVSPPSTPSTGQSSLYIATSGSPFIKNDAGVESPIALGGVWHSYTPVWTASTTNPVIGNGTISGRYCIIGKLCTLTINLTMGATTTFGTGAYSFSLPLQVSSTTNFYTGNWIILDSGAAWYIGMCALSQGQTALNLFYKDAGGTSGFSPTNPITWAANDQLRVQIAYEIA